MEKILFVILAVLGIAAAHVIGPRIRVAAPLLLVVAGAIIGVLPFVPEVEVDPEWILIGVLPPLLYSAAVSMPTMDFRRDFAAISAMSVVLVVISSVVLGVFFDQIIPGVDLATGIALGAIVSPTDAVATSIAKRLGVPGRVIAILEGESLLNDATALVLLRAAVAATAAGFSFGHVAVSFLWAVIAAVAIGAVVGWGNLWVRRRVGDATVNTAISFTVPYLAYLPAEELGASGLVAAVTAGLITGAGAVRYLSPRHRVSDAQNWRTVEFLAEGGVFLLMGLELWALLVDVRNDHGGIVTAVWIGLSALAMTAVVRALYVTPLIVWLDRVARRRTAMRPYLENMDASIVEKSRRAAADGTGVAATSAERGRRPSLRFGRAKRNRARAEQLSTAAFAENPESAQRVRDRITRAMADIDYYTASPMGPKEGAIIVWAGMRGVVTLAAAQTLPADTPSRELLVLIAFVVAAASLIVQGGTLGWLIRVLRLADVSDDRAAERTRLHAELSRTASETLARSDVAGRFPWIRERIEKMERQADADDTVIGTNLAFRAAFEQTRREVIDAQRETLMRMRSTGTYHSNLLSHELAQLDAEEISLDMRVDDD
ncbi:MULTISPECIES: cation:proton antiporter [Gordonia]|uniref:Sodium:proton antiporter n=1 Tax=Gordonia tangerina TaxID=2911060 RepID=A0ABS9DRV5_9ACTN|nr:sodium:proton antiporter [Gordonia tangerina]MCF3940548.1 sodium:proton antiporter [Gordonia tangerina]